MSDVAVGGEKGEEASDSHDAEVATGAVGAGSTGSDSADLAGAGSAAAETVRGDVHAAGDQHRERCAVVAVVAAAADPDEAQQRACGLPCNFAPPTQTAFRSRVHSE